MVDNQVCDERHKSIEARLDDVEKTSREFVGLVADIRELVVEIKYMRADMSNHGQRIDKLESKDATKWDKFKWLVLGCFVTTVFGLCVAIITQYI